MKTLLIIFIVITLTGCNLIKQPSEIVNPTSSQPTLQQKVITEKKSHDLEYIKQFPIEYQRLTIPYLRSQTFPGSPIQINQTVSNNSSYTSYLSSYQSEDLNINALLTRPKSPMPDAGYPAVVFIHGYIPPLEYRTTEKYVSYVDYLAKQGIVVFKIDLRGHGSSQGDPNGAYYSSDYIYDTLNAYASLQKLDYVNPNKIALWGHSMAGNVVFRSMVVNPKIPLGIIWAGAVYTYQDMRDFGISDGSYQPSQNPNRGRRQDLYDSVGEFAPDNPFWKLVIPTNYLTDFQGKIDLHHSSNDPVVSIQYSQNLQQILNSSSITNQLYTYPNGGHNIESPAFNSAISHSAQAINSL